VCLPLCTAMAFVRRAAQLFTHQSPAHHRPERSLSILSRKNRRNSAAKATIEASLSVASEQAEEFLRFLEYIEEQDELNKRTCAAPSPAGAVVAK